MAKITAEIKKNYTKKKGKKKSDTTEKERNFFNKTRALTHFRFLFFIAPY